MRTIIFTTLVCWGVTLPAQDDVRLFKPANAPADSATVAEVRPDQRTRTDSVATGVVTVVESDRIKALLADYAASKRPLEGYRIQIFLGDRAQAENTRRTFLLQHPDVPAYLSYLAPNFRVRVGDLRDRVEAAGLRESLKGEFPGLYVVPDLIELPKLPTVNN